MKILVIYYNWELNPRKTIIENIKSFEKYLPYPVYYLNIAWGIPRWVESLEFGAIIYHYTFLGLKWVNGEKKLFNSSVDRIIKIRGIKIAIPQDEYVFSNLLCRFFNHHKIDILCTCFFPEDYEKVYPKNQTGIKYYFTVLPGYVDDEAVVNWSKKNKSHKDRKIDLGYRARKNPFWLGKLGYYKWYITEKFNQIKSNLVFDLSNDPKDVFTGENWYKFLASCRCVLGVESGSSLLDPDGNIRLSVNNFENLNPNSSFELCEAACFPGQDGNINLSTVSPRHFEACITKTCQVLLEGNYANIFIPEKHYIEVKKDFSNIDQVIEKIKNLEYCEKIAEQAYNDIVVPGKLTYKFFVNNLIDFAASINNLNPADSSPHFLLKLKMREKYPYIFNPLKYLTLMLKRYIKLNLVKYGLLEFFIKRS